MKPRPLDVYSELEMARAKVTPFAAVISGAMSLVGCFSPPLPLLSLVKASFSEDVDR